MIARRTGGVLAGFILLLALENLVVGVGWRHLFVAPWEMGIARTHASPIALALLAPIALAFVLLAALARSPRGARAVPALAARAGLALGFGVTYGRHFRLLPVRVAFVFAVAAAVGLAAKALVPLLVRASPRALALVGAATGAGAWVADVFVLPRLYPAFHGALALTTLAGFAAVSPLLAEGPRGPWIARAALVLTGGSLAWAWFAGFGLAPCDNLRLVLVEHAPVLGRAVLVAGRWAPPPPLEPDAREDAPRASATRALDWTGQDVVLLTIDALRADHVSSYGYARRTTPSIDRLAAAGARFTHAYCPTPHTSYSVTSLMTGKHIRPLLALGVGDDSETWAGYLRRYGYRTGAFYPPAVFFIDEERFTGFRDRGLDFEYRKVEFAKPDVAIAHVERFLAGAPADRPLFVWMHAFEPHEPYEAHAAFPFGEPGRTRDVDAYDSEIALADDVLGKVVALFQRRRSGAVVIVTADHGEEFGDHGGRYHGTTVYEEQVRVPLVIVGPGVAPRVVTTPVQTIDLLPTLLSALGIPRPPRVTGSDLGGLLAGAPPESERVAFAETDEYTMTAERSERLVCHRRLGACALYDVAVDPLETRDLSRERPGSVQALRRRTRALELEHGRYEMRTQSLPEALRRGLQGDADAALDVAALLDDAQVSIRRTAAEIGFRLRAPDARPQTRRTLSRDEDATVRRWCALALVRMGDPPTPLVAELLEDREWRARAALVLAERGDPRGGAVLVEVWDTVRRDFETAKDTLAALAKVATPGASRAIRPSLADVRLRPHVVDALAALRDEDARPELLALFERERYQTLRAREARALAALGARDELVPGLRRFAGVPEPLAESIGLMIELGLLEPRRGGARQGRARGLDATVAATRDVPLRLLVRADAVAAASVGGAEVLLEHLSGGVLVGDVVPQRADRVRIAVSGEGITGAWLVPIARELPPPPPEIWDAGPGDN